MGSETFTMRHGLPEAEGLKVGQRVLMLTRPKAPITTTSSTAGADGIIECIERIPGQGLTFTLWIPVNELEGRGIVNVFDERDGPITKFITPMTA
jgi:hypothetical protein